jgi:hypothetical protein
LIAVEGLEPYLYCLKSDGSGEPWRVLVRDANKYLCTSPEGEVEARKYVADVQAWMQQNCNGGN